MDLKRAVITGMGAVSSIGTGIKEINKSLIEGKSGIKINTVQNISAGIKRIITEILSLDKEKLIDFVWIFFIRELRLFF